MFQLVYVSSAVKEFSHIEIVEMLNQWREKNHSLGVTGMMLYKEGNIMQALEGEKAVVHDIFKTISSDPRHYGVIAILEKEVEKRMFTDWSMGFRNLSDPQIQALPGFSRFMYNTLSYENNKDDPSDILELLNLFRM